MRKTKIQKKIYKKTKEKIHKIVDSKEKRTNEKNTIFIKIQKNPYFFYKRKYYIRIKYKHKKSINKSKKYQS